ncbi:AMP-binding protein [Streptomyces sp. G2]|uniref:AMP-binding protein n=1 Tax=Streptomyces sp. G2 TaxID=1684471 RepID=UPI00202DFE1C|nr:AMP-binding protein [Streptomyces sp. G2]MCM1947034.1 AMP-binding protein [Streptomyces sp. G2]
MTETLLRLMESRGALSSLTFVEEDRTLSLADLLAESRATAAGLIARGAAPGDRVAFIMQNGSGFLKLLFGAQYAHAVPLSIALPFGYGGVDGYIEHVRGILEDADVRLLVVDPDLARVRRALAEALTEVTVVSAEDLDTQDLTAVPEGSGDPDRPAYIQYTSGSTSRPKGVPLTHANVIAGLHALATPSGTTSEDRWGLWVPLFHDMGMFCLLTALSAGADVVLWRPRGGIRRPLEWLRRFAAEGCTHTAAPNFFADALVDAAKAAEAPLEPADLSAWRVWCNGAETVNAHSLAAFEKTFASWGFRPRSMCPVYGMAEATLTVTFPPSRREPVVRWVDREALAGGTFVPSGEGPGARPLVGVGHPVPGVEVRVCGDDGPLPEGRAGEIEITGPPVMAGYYRRERGDEWSPDGWYRTGDIGVVADGELFIFGRKKDMIVVRGVNYYAEDAETVVRDLPGVFRKRCAAVADDDHLALVVETSLETEEERAALVAECHRQIRSRMGLDRVTVHLAPTRFLPQTSSGKVQRHKLRSSLGELVADGSGGRA